VRAVGRQGCPPYNDRPERSRSGEHDQGSVRPAQHRQHRMGQGPAEMSRVTVLPPCIRLPAGGASATICPAGTLLDAKDCRATWRFCALSCWVAVATVEPMTVGTTTTRGVAGEAGAALMVEPPDSESVAMARAATATIKADAASTTAPGKLRSGSATMHSSYASADRTRSAACEHRPESPAAV
jgi:hypothetical protein